jgi:hypothetical protein
MIDEEVLRAVKARGARTGKRRSEVVEEALRHELGLDLLDHLWQSDDLREEPALALRSRGPARTRAPG